MTKKALSRRTILRGIGASVGLPLLDAMVPALSAMTNTAAKAVRRLGFIYMANGVAMSIDRKVNYWRPKGVGKQFEFSPILAPLEPFRDRLVVVSGLTHAQAIAADDGNGEHTRATATWLNGVRPKLTEGADIQAGTTVDQVAARQMGQETPLPSLELGIDSNYLSGSCDNGYSCVYMNTLAWQTPTTPLPVENNPRVVFERLFGDGGTAEQRVTQMRASRSILDSVNDELASLLRSLGPVDRSKASDYVEAIREIERRIQKAEQSSAESPLPALERPLGVPNRFDEHVNLMFDLQWLAYRADITRVCTFALGREVSGRTFPEIGVSEPHHGLSHHRDDPAMMETFARTNTYHVSLFSSFLEKMQSTPDGDGSLLDNSLLLLGAGLSNGNHHEHDDLPTVLVGGGGGRLEGGRHLEYPHDTPMMNFLLAMVEKAGVEVERLGDSRGKVDLLTGV